MNIDIPPLDIFTVGGVALFLMALFLGFFYFMNYWMEIRRKHPELDILNTSRKRPFPPIIEMVDPSDKTLMFNGVLEKKTDIKLAKKDYGLLIDPKQLTLMPKTKMEDGTNRFFYGAGFHFPVSPNGARTIVQFIDRVRKEYPKLNFIRDDIVLIELFTKSGTDLPKDVRNILKMYPLENPIVQIDDCDRKTAEEILRMDETEQLEYQLEQANKEDRLTVDKIVELVEDAKTKIKGWRVEPGYFSMHDGISLLPIGTMSSDMTRLETITKMNTANDLMKEPDPWMNTLKFVALIGGGLLLAWMIISAMAPKGGA